MNVFLMKMVILASLYPHVDRLLCRAGPWYCCDRCGSVSCRGPAPMEAITRGCRRRRKERFQRTGGIEPHLRPAYRRSVPMKRRVARSPSSLRADRLARTLVLRSSVTDASCFADHRSTEVDRAVVTVCYLARICPMHLAWWMAPGKGKDSALAAANGVCP